MQINGNSIRNIIFDLGGIILNIDYKKTERAFIELGFENFPQLYSQFHASDLFINLETGRISAFEFIREIKKHASRHVSDQEIISAWNAMLLDFPPGRLNFLFELKNRYRSFLLSNTNEIHYQAIQENYSEAMGKEHPLDSCFEKAYYSHDLGMRKPDESIYNYVLKQHHLNPAETLFIDDTKANVQGAANVGIHAIYLTSSTPVEAIFEASMDFAPYLISSKSI